MTTIPLADLKTFLNVEGTADDEVLSQILAGSEAFTNRFLSTPIAGMDPLPADLKMAVLLLSGHFYNNREATTADFSVYALPLGFADLIQAHRGWSF
jgi:hypothetical protein